MHEVIEPIPNPNFRAQSDSRRIQDETTFTIVPIDAGDPSFAYTA
jgi:hypothetical protein